VALALAQKINVARRYLYVVTKSSSSEEEPVSESFRTLLQEPQHFMSEAALYVPLLPKPFLAPRRVSDGSGPSSTNHRAIRSIRYRSGFASLSLR